MNSELITTVIGVAIVMALATVGAHAAPACSTAVGCLHSAPAPLLAAGIPAFVALGGGVAGRQLWRRFVRRS